MYDIECPYCEAGLNIDHDDGYGYEEDVNYNQTCSNCDKTFVYTTSVHYHYSPKKAECLNGKKHDYKPNCTFPKRDFLKETPKRQVI